jgi:nucleoside-diphosphate kinase
MFKLLTLLATSLFAEQTLSIIKPEAVSKADEINAYYEVAGLHVTASKEIHLTREQAQEFYAVHKERPFYNELVAYMSSGPIIVQVLEGDAAVVTNRSVMGPTDPTEAPTGTIRGDFGTDIQQNAVHGSDSLENAQKEIAFFFTSEKTDLPH